MFDEQTYKVRGYTFVTDFHLCCDRLNAQSDLSITLAAATAVGAPVVTAHFGDVADLTIRDFGGGWTQLLYVAVEDVGAEQRDRVRYRVHDHERGALSFVCRTIEVETPVQS